MAPGALSTIAFVVSDNLFEAIHRGDEFYGRHLIALQKAITDAGLYPLLIGSHQDLTADGQLRCVVEKRVQAVIAESWEPTFTGPGVRPVPVVLYNRISPYVDHVLTDMHLAARTQFDHLSGLGHRQVALFRINTARRGWEDEAFLQEYLSFQNRIGQPFVAPVPLDFGPGEEATAARRFVDQLLGQSPRPTAILTHDTYSGVLLDALNERGIRVPEEMSLLGFNDLSTGTTLTPPLSSYRQNFEALAGEAVRLLLDRARHPDLPPRQVRLPGALVLRGSTAAAPQVV